MNRILIVRTSALGDIVHSLPVLTALRRRYPEARIGWVVEDGMSPLLEGHPDLDELLRVRLRPWRRRPFARETLREVRAFLDALDRFAPDAVLDLMGNHKAGLLAVLSASERRIGPAWRRRREPSSGIWINEGVEPRGTHAVDRALSLAAPLGVPPEPADFGPGKLFREEPELPDEARRVLGSGPFVLIHPGAGWANKTYPPARWGAAARELRTRTGLPVHIALARGEERLAAEVEAASDGAVRAVSAPSIPILAALLRRASLVMGGDSGPTHLAHALGTPVLMLLGPTDPARHGPYGAPDRALWKELPCSFCYRRFPEAKPCMTVIPPGRVAARAAEILSAAG